MKILLIGFFALVSISSFAKVETRCLKEVVQITGAKECIQLAIYKASDRNAKLLCNLNGLELFSFETEEVILKGFNGSVQFQQISPKKIIPSIPMDSFRIVESMSESGPSFTKIEKKGFKRMEVISNLICD